MKVKVTGCSKDTYWYKECIGESFEILKQCKDGSVVFKINTRNHYIANGDFIYVSE